jgi:hypothetical protein
MSEYKLSAQKYNILYSVIRFLGTSIYLSGYLNLHSKATLLKQLPVGQIGFEAFSRS